MTARSLATAAVQLSVGVCFLAQGSQGLHEVSLVTPTEMAADPDPPAWARTVQARLQAQLDGASDPLHDLELDLTGIPPFHQRVYHALRQVGPGSTVTYQELATRAGSPAASRAVGQAMRRNRHILIIPCHRVLGSHGALGGFSAPGGTELKARLLQLEGALRSDARPSSAAASPTGHGAGPAPAARTRARRPVAGDATPKGGTSRRQRVGSSPAGSSPTRPLEEPPLPPGFDPLRPVWEADGLERATAWLTQQDARLGACIARLGGCELVPPSGKTLFAALCEAVIYQQLAGTAARAITLRYCKELGGGGFPEPAAVVELGEARLRSCGLSGAKASTILAAAEAITSGELDLEALALQPDAEVSAALTRLRGVGPWTVQMLLMFHLGRPDVLPCGDLGVRKALAQLDELPQLPSPREVAERGSCWAPFRAVAAWYLWKSLGGVTIG